MKRILAMSAIAAAVVAGSGRSAHADGPCHPHPVFCIISVCVTGAGVVPHTFCVGE